MYLGLIPTFILPLLQMHLPEIIVPYQGGLGIACQYLVLLLCRLNLVSNAFPRIRVANQVVDKASVKSESPVSEISPIWMLRRTAWYKILGLFDYNAAGIEHISAHVVSFPSIETPGGLYGRAMLQFRDGTKQFLCMASEAMRAHSVSVQPSETSNRCNIRCPPCPR